MSATRKPRIVVGVDDTLAGMQALRFAVAEARRRGVVLRAIRAWQYGMPWYGPDLAPRHAELVDEAAMTIVNAFQDAMGGMPHDIVVEAQAIEGAPAVVLVDQANSDRDLLVVGRSRRRLFGRLRVDARCMRSATCPVVTVAAPVLAADGDATGLGRDVVSAADALLRNAAAPHRATD
jgi:nucleotide-binding universal stress UspA family protein